MDTYDCAEVVEAAKHLRRISLDYARAMNAALGKLGLRLSGFAALEALRNRGALTMSTLGRESGLTLGSWTNLIDHLLGAGFVTRQPDERDRRVVRVAITDQGAAALEEALRLETEYMALRLSMLTPAEVSSCLPALRKLSGQPAAPR